MGALQGLRAEMVAIEALAKAAGWRYTHDGSLPGAKPTRPGSKSPFKVPTGASAEAAPARGRKTKGAEPAVTTATGTWTPAADHPAAGAPAGHHAVVGSDDPKHVPTAARAGVYAAGPDRTFGHRYSVTHLPTGMSVGRHVGSKAAAKALVKRLHERAPNAGADARWGEGNSVSTEALEQIQGAMKDWNETDHHWEAKRAAKDRGEAKRAEEDDVRTAETTPPGFHGVVKGFVNGDENDVVKHNERTTHRSGVYGVHKTEVRDRRGKVVKATHTVTHLPSGYAVGHYDNAADAKGVARHLHARAPNAGAGTTFGRRPAAEHLDRISDALDSWR